MTRTQTNRHAKVVTYSTNKRTLTHTNTQTIHKHAHPQHLELLLLLLDCSTVKVLLLASKLTMYCVCLLYRQRNFSTIEQRDSFHLSQRNTGEWENRRKGEKWEKLFICTCWRANNFPLINIKSIFDLTEFIHATQLRSVYKIYALISIVLVVCVCVCAQQLIYMHVCKGCI